MRKGKYEYKGIFGLTNIANAFDFPLHTLRRRVVNLGMPVSDAIEMKVEDQVRYKYEHNGIKGLKNIAAAYGVPHKTLESRVIGQGIDIETALTKPIQQRKTKEIYRVTNQKKYSEKLLSLALGIGGSHA
ncbi:hypothetical protein ND926_04380 [Vibrio diabolicus]|uniref:hypothetical protein n=1 Tax=Vibrio harveyi group TaxID=717610 RepID=UPI00081BCE78|nr:MULTISPECIES: hypothetical protein [Vibrio harveyi group]EGU6978528.1 hypothetical protein [Vibrio parahaemolyticus]MCC3792532.1 hypothetical protein [Vibrio parahaemolyticus]MCS0336698.1 hypothetical protein [Vibrio diabolicus]MCZ6309805.1 hypothetical protein [Vibrio parahaemolyticus]MDF5476297.1 hypothetical protein [Vibrio parahaemolyticus]